MAQGWLTKQWVDPSFYSPITELVQTKDQWALSVADAPGSLSATSSSRRSAIKLYDCTKTELQVQIEALKGGRGLQEASEAVWQSMEMAGLSKAIWKSERQTSRKTGAAFQASMTGFSRFLENFSGIVTIAQAADQQYGGIAYGTLSLLLSVFVHKTQREDALEAGFEELSFAFPRLATLKDLCRSEEDTYEKLRPLEGLIASTFYLVLKFSREATQYYSSRWRRWKDTFKPEQAKGETLADIRKNLEEVRHECDILMLTRITSLQYKMDALMSSSQATHTEVVSTGRQLDSTHVELRNTQRQLARARDSSDASHLSQLRQILSIEDPSSPRSPHTNLLDYQSLLKHAFSEKTLRSKYCHPKEVSMELLRADGEFRRWWESHTSCLLLAGGTNFLNESASGSLNWLSLAAIAAVHELRQQQRHVAFYLSQTTWTVTARTRHPIRKAMASIIYQIAEMHDDLLRSKIDTIKSAVSSSAWNSEDADQTMELIHRLLLDIFSAFPREEAIVIVLDRLDQLAWIEDEDGSREPDMRHAIEWLVCVAAEASCCVKVLVTVDAGGSRRLEKTRDALDLPKHDRKALLLKAEWCQATEDGRAEE